MLKMLKCESAKFPSLPALTAAGTVPVIDYTALLGPLSLAILPCRLVNNTTTHGTTIT